MENSMLKNQKSQVTQLFNAFYNRQAHLTLLEEVYTYTDEMFITLLKYYVNKHAIITRYEHFEYNRQFDLEILMTLLSIKPNGTVEDAIMVVKTVGQMFLEDQEVIDNIISVHDKRHDCPEDKQYGAMALMIFEEGYFIKVFGEVNKQLLGQMINRARSYRDEVYYDTHSWGEILDVRDWDLLTFDSLELAKENSSEASERHKKFTVYVVGKEQVNSYILSKIPSGTGSVSSFVEDIYLLAKLLMDKNYRLGKLLHLDYVGNIELIK